LHREKLQIPVYGILSVELKHREPDRMRQRKLLKFADLPEWVIDPNSRPDRYSVAAAFMLADLSDKWVRLTADSQRLVFGANLFGKCQLKVDDNGLKVTRKVCFGIDFVCTWFDWETLERVIADGRRPAL
jgi:hypothetical protein